jgi:hypothetical protein
MRKVFWLAVVLVAAVVIAAAAAGPTHAGDIVYKPIDTNKFVVKPTQAAADLAAATINLLGRTTADTIDRNGYVKTINNLFGKKVVVPHTQLGPSPLPSPNLFPSTQYKNYNNPVRPIMAPAIRP